MLIARSNEGNALDAPDALIFGALDPSSLPRTGAEAREFGSAYYFTGRTCRHGHVAPRYTHGGSCSLCARIRSARFNNRPLVTGVRAVGRKLRAEAVGTSEQTYVPSKPCKHGHMLRWTSSGNCVDCHNVSRAKRREANRDGWIKKEYGLDPHQHEQMFQDQNRACAVCETEFAHRRLMHVDHCHQTGKIRALLCSKCNQALGLLGDSPRLMLKAAEYVNAHAS